MTTELKNEVDSIVKFISKLFNPADVWVISYSDPDRYSITFYFDDIDDRYIRNPDSRSIKTHKENMLNREIRTYVERYLGIKTSGLQPPDFFSPEEKHPISVYVMHTS